MGILAKSLSPQSAYAAKKTDLWPSLMERLTDCMFAADVDAFERHVISLGLQIPAAWHEQLAEQAEKRREEIKEDDVATIMRERFDF